MVLGPLYRGSSSPSVTAMWERAYIADRLQADDLAGIKALADAYGPAEDYQYNFLDTTWPPSFVVFHWGDVYEGSLQGTSNTKQVLLHLSGTVVPRSVADTASVNSQWDDQAQTFQTRFEDYIRGKPFPSRIVLGGHSYGAGVGGILATRLKGQYPSVRVEYVSYGSPRWGTGTGFSHVPDAEVRVVQENDPVPTIPPRYTDVGLVASGLQLVGLTGRGITWSHRGQRVFLKPSGEVGVGGVGEEEPLTWPGTSLQAWGDAHYIKSYRASLAKADGVNFPPGWVNGSPGPQTPSGTQQTPVAPAKPLDQTGVDAANRVYYPGVSGPVTVDNQGRFQSTSLQAGIPQILVPTNIGGFSAMTPDTVVKCTLIINNGRYGHAETHYLQAPSASPSAKAAVVAAVSALANQRSLLLGNSEQLIPTAPSLGVPWVQYVRCVDPAVPKKGFLVDLTDGPYYGFSSTGSIDNTAEAYQKAIMVRMSAADALATPTTRNSTLQIVGFPDQAADGYDYQPKYMIPGWAAFGATLRGYINFLAGLNVFGTGPAMPRYVWGFLIAGTDILPRPPAVYNQIVPNSWAYTNPPGQWQFTTGGAPPTAWLPGDRVRIKSSNNVFNGTWAINPVGGNVYALIKGPVSGHTPPKGGVVYRVESQGVTLLNFAQYILVPDAAQAAGNPGVVPCRVSHHKPGKQWFPESFARKVRRER